MTFDTAEAPIVARDDAGDETANSSAGFTAAGRPFAPRRADLDAMLGFATEGEAVAGQLRGLAALFRAMFFNDDLRRSDDGSAAADVIDDVLKSIAARLDANAERARATRDHLAAGGRR